MEPLISIIVPAYNGARWLPRCLDSILAQTYPNLEILVVDDGSTDDTGRILGEYAARDSRILPVFKENGGIGKARNTGMEKAGGQYIMFVDSDDYLPQDAVKVLLDRILLDGSDLAIGKYLSVYENGKMDGKSSEFMKDLVLSSDELLLEMGTDGRYQVALWGKLYTRKCLDGIVFPALTCAEDMYVFPDIIQQCHKISLVSHNVYFYFQRSGSIMHNKKDRQNLDSIRAHQHMIDGYLRKDMLRCAGVWFCFAVRLIQELQDIDAGVALMENVYTQTQIKQMLRNTDTVTRVKWVLVRRPRLYHLVFDFKRKCFG